ncbi:hypothetical protein B0T25DRAFT_555084 [Lasiosphaeria hispida]|uniref:Uncharacterized protein n=1 Tax=Lasiosphaeria hispida TaxID=260671 RepID=A0AAJ0M987_9PEZI|nr:hypothetical protein B0T25DRAFT_555084 [Lasiosphaeria hispida]
MHEDRGLPVVPALLLLLLNCNTRQTIARLRDWAQQVATATTQPKAGLEGQGGATEGADDSRPELGRLRSYP